MKALVSFASNRSRTGGWEIAIKAPPTGPLCSCHQPPPLILLPLILSLCMTAQICVQQRCFYDSRIIPEPGTIYSSTGPPPLTLYLVFQISFSDPPNSKKSRHHCTLVPSSPKISDHYYYLAFLSSQPTGEGVRLWRVSFVY